MRVRLAILLLFLPLVAFGQSKIFDFDARKGSLLDQVSKVQGVATDVEFKRDSRGLASRFNGSSSKIDTGTDMIGTKAVTVCGWFRFFAWGETGDYGRILDNGSTIVFIRDFGAIGTTSSASTEAYSVNYSIALNRWQFASITRESDGTVNFYIGDKNTSPSLSGTADQDSGTPVSGTTNVIIGNNNAQTRTFDGNIESINVYEGILSLSQITDIYNKSLNSYGIFQTKRNFAYPKPTDLSYQAGLVAAYNFIPTEKTLTDISGNGNTGTINGALTTYDGMRFDGVDDYVRVSSISPSLNGASAASIALKCKPINITGTQYAVSLPKDVAGLNGFDVVFSTSGTSVRSYISTSSGTVSCTVSNGFVNGIDINVVVTYNGSIAKIFINGLIADSVAQTGALSLGSEELSIGSFSSTLLSSNIEIQDLKIFNYALSESEEQPTAHQA